MFVLQCWEVAPCLLFSPGDGLIEAVRQLCIAFSWSIPPFLSLCATQLWPYCRHLEVRVGELPCKPDVDCNPHSHHKACDEQFLRSCTIPPSSKPLCESNVAPETGIQNAHPRNSCTDLSGSPFFLGGRRNRCETYLGVLVELLGEWQHSASHSLLLSAPRILPELSTHVLALA